MKLSIDFSLRKFAFYFFFFFLFWHFLVSTYNSAKEYLVWTVYQSWYQKAFEEVSDLIEKSSNWQCVTFEMSSKWKVYDIQWCKKQNTQWEDQWQAQWQTQQESQMNIEKQWTWSNRQ